MIETGAYADECGGGDFGDQDHDDGPEMPSCIESLVSSAEQLHQLARTLDQYYIKTLLCYAYAAEPASDQHSRPLGSNNVVGGTTGGGGGPENGATHAQQGPVVTSNNTGLKLHKHSHLELNKLLADQKTLECLDSILDLIPFLNELSSHLDLCFVTIESTLRRSTYYLNKAATRAPTTSDMTNDDFQLPSEAKIHPIFVALMDLVYAIVSLDKTIQSHTNICQNLSLFKTACQLVIVSSSSSSSLAQQSATGARLDGSIDCDIFEIPKNKLTALVDFIDNIQLTLCNGKRTIFQQCLEHLQHLNMVLSSMDNKKTNRGHKNLCEHFEEFLQFYASHLIEQDPMMNDTNGCCLPPPPPPNSQAKLVSIYLVNLYMIPTLYMTSGPRKIFGVSALFILYSWIFKKQDRRISKLIMQILRRFKAINLLPLLGSNCYLLLDEFLSKHLPKSLLDMKVLKHLQDQDEVLLKLNTNAEFDRLTMHTFNWLMRHKAETLKGDGGDDASALRTKVALLQQGLRLTEELNHIVKIVSAVYLHRNKSMSKNNLVFLLRLVALLKSIEASLRTDQMFVHNCVGHIEHLTGNKWRRLIESAQKRLISMRYSERKLNTASTLTLSSICSRAEHLTTNHGRTIMSYSLSMLLPYLSADEVEQLNQLLASLTQLNTFERLDSAANCGHLYWNLPTFGTYYNYAFEEDPCAFDEVQYFHMAVNDIPSLFSVTRETSALRNAAALTSFDPSWLLSKRDEFLDRLGDELVDQFQTDFIEKICLELEIELRLQTHRDLNLDDHNPFTRHLYNFKQIFAADPCQRRSTFRIFDRLISTRYYVERYLNRVCYNLTAIAPHDWFTYDNMINLARHKYNLQFVNTQLPIQTLDFGLDLLDITRNLALFVSRYGYDLTNQLFIEKCSNRLSTMSSAGSISVSGLSAAPNSSNLSLNVVQIRHVAKSIQTHGYGLLNSSVNCTYQAMKKLINLLSKQLSDSKLRSVLGKEHQRLVVAASSTHNSQQASTHTQAGVTQSASLSFERANRLAKKFRLSVTSALDQTNNQQHPVGVDLDSIRQSITQLGNLLAFIRMLKSGALNCVSKSVDYLPDLGALSSLRLANLVKSEFQGYHCESLTKAAENFDQCLTDFDENFSPKTNYFNIIIGLFSNIIATTQPPVVGPPTATQTAAASRDGDGRSKEGIPDGGDAQAAGKLGGQTTNKLEPQASGVKRGDHLRLFFLLVPALTINYIDYLINCKERVSSRSSAGRLGALISDDGFSMGVAFLLTILKQTGDFARLEWSKQVRQKLEEDRKEVEQRIGDSREEESLRQTLAMTLRRLNRLRVEYDGLDYTLSSALLFFRSSTFASPSS